MRRDLEACSPSSCWNKARGNELVFVLLGRDPAAPAAIRAWCEARIKGGHNLATDAQITEALDLADAMTREAT